MKLQEVFDQLSDGEFSQLSIGGADAGVIDETNYSKVLGHINLGLTALFTRFSLKEGRVYVPLVANTETYVLSPADILKITKVETDDGIEIPLNQESNIYSCFTPAMSTLRIPEIIVDQGSELPDLLKTAGFTVVYRANHPKLAVQLGLLSPSTLEVELPSSHLLPLLYFVASRVHNPIGMNNEFHAGNSYYKKYEHACQELEGKGIQVDQGDQNTRLERNGWI